MAKAKTIAKKPPEAPLSDFAFDLEWIRELNNALVAAVRGTLRDDATDCERGVLTLAIDLSTRIECACEDLEKLRDSAPHLAKAA